MTSSDTRFWLSFTSGAREGERVPLPGGTSSVGRRSDNAIPVSHSSVSGKHAELRVSEGGVLLVDLDSTNGTRVGAERISERTLTHGDVILFGSVRAHFEDATLAEDDGAPLLEGDQSPAPAPAAGALASVSAERLAASGGSRGKLGLVLFVLLLGAGAFAVWRFLPRGEGGRALPGALRVEGNLLDDGTFEDSDAAKWETAESAPQAFYLDGAFANRGAVGLGCRLADGEWAHARSRTFSLPMHRGLTLAAELSVAGRAVGRVGLELSASDGSLPAIVAWAPATRSTDGSQPVSLAFDTQNGYDTGAVVVAAESAGDGDVALDDVSVVLGAALGPNATFEEYELFVLGEGGSTAVLVRSGRVLFASIALSDWRETGLSGWSDGSWTGESTETGFLLRASAQTPAGAFCSIVTAGDRPLSAEDGDELRIATIGPDGYRAQATTFEEEAATDVLGGGGVNMIRVGLESPAKIACRYLNENARLRIEFGGQRTLELQLTFRAERQEAASLARTARDAEKRKEYGRAMATWSDLLDRFPFEAKLIDEAQASLARLGSLGHDRIEEVRAELDRARFFQLEDIFARCRTSAVAVVEAFRGSATESEALALVDEIDTTVLGLAAGRSGTEARRLERVLEALDPQASPTLRAHVSETMAAFASDSASTEERD